jgi:hypothetical protein
MQFKDVIFHFIENFSNFFGIIPEAFAYNTVGLKIRLRGD